MEPAGRASELTGRAPKSAGRASKPAGRPSEPAERPWGGTNGRTDGRTEFLPILQDFVPYRGCCPATIEVTIKKTIKETVEQGKGTGDHLMPLGDWFFGQQP